MRFDHPILYKFAALLGTTAVRAWMDTLDYRVLFYDADVDPASPRCQGQKIYVFWHEYILFPFAMRGNCNLAMLLSMHRDAEILSRVAYHLGFDFVRGSTRRGGVAALRRLLAKSGQMHLTITPDGPRGPRRKMSAGPIYVASRLSMPIVLLGFGYERPWRFAKAWDQFAVPRPYSRARVVVAPEMRVPPDLSRRELNDYCVRAETALERVTQEAEVWAESGAAKAGQRPLVAGPIQPLLERG